MKITVLPQNSLADKNKWRVLNPSKCPLNIILIIYILITSSLPYELLSTENYELQLGKNENITCNSNSSVYIQAFKFTGNIFTLFFLIISVHPSRVRRMVRSWRFWCSLWHLTLLFWIWPPGRTGHSEFTMYWVGQKVCSLFSVKGL